MVPIFSLFLYIIFKQVSKNVISIIELALNIGIRKSTNKNLTENLATDPKLIGRIGLLTRKIQSLSGQIKHSLFFLSFYSDGI